MRTQRFTSRVGGVDHDAYAIEFEGHYYISGFPLSTIKAMFRERKLCRGLISRARSWRDAQAKAKAEAHRQARMSVAMWQSWEGDNMGPAEAYS